MREGPVFQVWTGPAHVEVRIEGCDSLEDLLAVLHAGRQFIAHADDDDEPVILNPWTIAFVRRIKSD